MNSSSIVKYHSYKERQDNYRLKYQRKLHVTNDLIRRLGLEVELEGHSGCVNCLEWNERGDLLASGSDDLHIILWDPFSHKKLQTIQSGHHGNIFSVKFLPNSNDGTVVSGAADFKIRVHDINTRETTMACSCHLGRVKRLAVAPNVPFMFWSAAEDGIVMQYDLRVPHHCSTVCNSVLINLVNHLGRNAEAKCVAINPLKPELLAVGANDPYVRIYDRRMISPTTIQYPSDSAPRSSWQQSYMACTPESAEDNLPPGCVAYYVAGHLPLKQTDYKKRYRTLTSTYLAFSPDGSELLANLGGEQIYLFNLLSRRRHKTFDIKSFPLSRNGTNGFCKNNSPETCFHANGFISSKNGTTNGITTTNGVTSRILPDIPTSLGLSTPTEPIKKKWTPQILPPKVEKIKKKANEHFEKQAYTFAINLYNKGIILCPTGACLYGNRAAAYIKRGWDGDIYAALRDCHSALKLDPDYLKAHFRLAQCLHKLHWTKEALDCLQAFRVKFPEYSQTQAFEVLEKDIKAAIYAESETEEASNGNLSESQGSSNNSASPRHTKPLISDKEKVWRAAAYDYEARFCGHCNTTTDIKEANFFGSDGQYIIAGSDDGSFFMWDRITTNIVRVLRGDDSIVNCLQPHHSTCLLATSGIDTVVRLWSPRPEDGSKEDREIIDSEEVAVANQKRMNADPLEIMLMNMGYRIPGVLDAEELDNDSSEHNMSVQCRTS